MTDKKTPRILSGIQPTGVLHIGNYFGMIQRAIALQNGSEAFYFIANYHALTSVRDPEVLRTNCRGVAIDFLACGFDPERGTLFMQSDVPQVTELCWILSTVAPMDCSNARIPTRTNSHAGYKLRPVSHLPCSAAAIF
jgi:tryptophanyl-tRNA synthetase